MPLCLPTRLQCPYRLRLVSSRNGQSVFGGVSLFSSGAIQSANERAERSNERAMEIRVLALQKSVGSADEEGDAVRLGLSVLNTR